MIELLIRGNKESYQLTKKIDHLEIRLIGDFEFNSNTSIRLAYENFNLTFNNRNELFKFSEEVIGANLDKLILTFSQYIFNNDFTNFLSNKKATEIGLLKALFLIFHWIELHLTDSLKEDLENQIYNQFVVDLTNQQISQNDIYFIPKSFIIESNKSLIQKLVDLNLLATFKVTFPQNICYTTYFIPLNKPGVSRENFITEFDTKGNKTYNFWKQILMYRDIRISNWMNNRF